MKKIRTGEIIKAAGGRLISGTGENETEKVVIDSREVKCGDAFFALVGEINDGHDFLKQAMEKGARILAVSDEKKTEAALRDFAHPADLDVVLVPDTKKALQDLSKWYLSHLGLKAKIGVTGSVGKTSTRDLLYYVLSEKYKTARSVKNFNNSFGLPLSILSIEEGTEAAVIEMGMDGKGSVDLLADIVRPETAVITNVGVSHMENFPEEGRKGILDTKLEITNYFDDDSVLIINASNDMLGGVSLEERNIKGSLIKAGTGDDCSYKVSDVTDRGVSGITFTLEHAGKAYNIDLKVPGAHNALNAALAIACGVRYGITEEEAIRGLSKVELTEKRLSVKERNGIRVIDDTYNAAPDSVKSAINTLMASDTGEGGRRILITGDMSELGSESVSGHESVGAYAFEKGVDVLIAIGEKSCNTIRGWRRAAEGCAHPVAAVNEKPYIIRDETTGQSAEHFCDVETVISGIMKHIYPGDCILVKASRIMELERIVREIMEGQLGGTL